MSHTPGPWTVTRDRAGRHYCWIESAAQQIPLAHLTHPRDDLSGVIPNSDRIEDDPEALANAHLIAASPTMYQYIARQAAQGDAEATAILAAIEPAGSPDATS